MPDTQTVAAVTTSPDGGVPPQRGSGALIVLLIIVTIVVNVGLAVLAAKLTGAHWAPLFAWLATILLIFAIFGEMGRHKAPRFNAGTRDAPWSLHWLGVLVDQRNRVSLSRAQMLAWTVLVLSAILTEGVTNAILIPGGDSLTALDVPGVLWGLIGLSATSAVAAPAVLATKPEDIATRAPRQQNWRDLFRGDDASNADCVDLSKLQFIFLTLAAVLVYAIGIGHSLVAATATHPASFPTIGAGFLGLMGASNAAYLGYKALPQKRFSRDDALSQRGTAPPSPQSSALPTPTPSPASPTGEPIVVTEPPPPAPGD